jgi:hypothetical protein
VVQKSLRPIQVNLSPESLLSLDPSNDLSIAMNHHSQILHGFVLSPNSQTLCSPTTCKAAHGHSMPSLRFHSLSHATSFISGSIDSIPGLNLHQLRTIKLSSNNKARARLMARAINIEWFAQFVNETTKSSSHGLGEFLDSPRPSVGGSCRRATTRFHHGKSSGSRQSQRRQYQFTAMLIDSSRFSFFCRKEVQERI